MEKEVEKLKNQVQYLTAMNDKRKMDNYKLSQTIKSMKLAIQIISIFLVFNYLSIIATILIPILKK